MQLTDFTFDLPTSLIAQYPLSERSASRLLHLDTITQERHHGHFTDLPDLLQPNDLLIFNNTKVIPARLHGKKSTGGRAELLIERILSPQNALAYIKANHTPGIGSTITLDTSGYTATITARQAQLFKITFDLPSSLSLQQLLTTTGDIPLPPYIRRNTETLDHERYQTIFAKEEGAVAAPTAGLHFDAALMQRLHAKGVRTTTITLHVGAGTFQPIRTENITEHVIHKEYIHVPASVCSHIEQTRRLGGRVIAVGTTTVRSLETAARTQPMTSYQGETQLFIYPGYTFQCVDAIITNFHLPQSSLLLLVSAFAGRDLILETYKEAIKQKYRFFSYGDAMLLTAKGRTGNC